MELRREMGDVARHIRQPRPRSPLLRAREKRKVYIAKPWVGFSCRPIITALPGEDEKRLYNVSDLPGTVRQGPCHHPILYTKWKFGRISDIARVPRPALAPGGGDIDSAQVTTPSSAFRHAGHLYGTLSR
jgi:hypothetical protein